MDLNSDFADVRHICLNCDPSFDKVHPEQLAETLATLKDQNDPDRFLLAAMRCVALAENGHTRIIPNPAIQVFPLRIISVGAEFAAIDPNHDTTYRLTAINDHPVEQVFKASRPYLAGTPQRQRVVGPLLMTWPAALDALGINTASDAVTYHLSDSTGNASKLRFSAESLTKAGPLYSIWETGHRPTPVTPPQDVTYITLPNFGPNQSTPLETQITRASDRVHQNQKAPIVLDLRGNPGGDFLKTLPLLDALAAHWQGPHCVALVNKFTFSAAIVFVALLRHRLGERLHIVGEEMGDDTKFHAEGDMIQLHATGALLRYSTAWHDWHSGQPDETTPAEIAEHMIGAGDLRPDTRLEMTVSDLQHGRDPQQDHAVRLATRA
ncbi:S41 family peptidase [Tateyamaria sp. ANG-S1]|uniref:S41 family peptidase n=1 Tax=Tateyamaria sp. ANG-S1 TaxID=1577905 RepID=UPI00068996BA|nr:S41 family peptidase [Tateyamaria sp. ANG-S1]